MKIKTGQTSTYPLGVRITFMICAILLVLRIVEVRILRLFLDDTAISVYSTYYMLGAYVLALVLVWLNRDEPHRINVDFIFVILLFISGVLLFMAYLPLSLGWISLAGAIFVLWMLKGDHLKFVYPAIFDTGTIILLMLTFIPAALSYISFLLAGVHVAPNFRDVTLAFYSGNLPTALFEEILFRGILWMFLSSLKITENKIIVAQAIVFWLAHYEYLLQGDLFTFLLATPLIGVLYGIVTGRTKSISLTSVGHFLHNFLVGILRSQL